MFHPAFQVQYYNETHALWEPLIEQVDREGHRWNLKLEVSNDLMFLFSHLFSVRDKFTQFWVIYLDLGNTDLRIRNF